jgi:hypothetical protein
MRSLGARDVARARIAASVATALSLVAALVAGPVIALPVDVPIGQSPAASAEGELLSPIGTQAIEDLRECLASRTHLDVYYLVDASGSLFEKEGQVATDPGFVRADLIANSLRELGALGEDVDVSYALGFFGEEYAPSIGWTVAGADLDAETQRVSSAIRSQGSLGWTNWEAGIAGAQSALAAQHASTQGCQLLIWLTDGGINVSNSNNALDDAAVNNLCGTNVSGGADPAQGHGPFNEMRQSGAVVIGVLLNTASSSGRETRYRQFMRPLVEGEGTLDGAAITCGEHPVPEGYVAGAFVEATSADDLALVFLKLGAAVSGGALSQFDANGGFLVDEGVAQFAIVTKAADWSLQSPSGALIYAADPGDAELATSGGATRITVSPDASGIGRWMWSSAERTNDDLYYFSGLAIEIDEPGTFLVGADNMLSGRILRTDDRDIPLAAYDYVPSLAVVTSTGTSPIDSDRIELDPQTGEFTFYFTAEDATGVATLEARVDELVTLPSRLPLASVAAQREVTVTIPDQYPTVSPSPLVLSDLEGSDGEGSGEWTISAPADGTSGEVCFPRGLVPAIQSDSADRDDTWLWQVGAEANDEACIEVGAGLAIVIPVAASNPVAAYSKVQATLPVEYRAADGESIAGQLPLEFTSTRPVNVVVFGLTFFGLLLLGVLGPVALMYLVTFLTHKISRQGNIYRLRMPVRISPHGEVMTETGEPLRSLTFGSGTGADQFAYQTKSVDTRSMSDADLGQLRSRVPFPFLRPWYEITPNGGRRILGVGGWLPRRKSDPADRGMIAGFNGDLGTVWGLVVDPGRVGGAARTGPAEAGSDTVPATLVVYVRNTDTSPTVLRERMSQLLVPAMIKPKLDRMRASLGDRRDTQHDSPDDKPTIDPRDLPYSRPPGLPVDDLPPGYGVPGTPSTSGALRPSPSDDGSRPPGY